MARVCRSIRRKVSFLVLAVITLTILKLLIDVYPRYNADSSIINDSVATRNRANQHRANKHGSTQNFLRSYQVDSYHDESNINIRNILQNEEFEGFLYYGNIPETFSNFPDIAHDITQAPKPNTQPSKTATPPQNPATRPPNPVTQSSNNAAQINNKMSSLNHDEEESGINIPNVLQNGDFEKHQPHDSNTQIPLGVSSKSWLLDNRNILSDEPVSDDLLPDYFNISTDLIPQFERHFNETKSIMENRLQKLQQQCIQKSKPTRRVARIFYFPELNMTWCPVFKAGSTNWKQLFCKIYKPDVYYKYLQEVLHDPYCPLSYLVGYKNKAKQEKHNEAVEGSLKFLTVRHPYERLVSAYTNKFENCDSTTTPTFTGPNNRMVKILHGYRDVRLPALANKTELIEAARLECKKLPKDRVIDRDNPYMNPMGATFREFVEYIVKSNDTYDLHWAPISDECGLCIQDYDIIEKFETLERDHYFILKTLGEESWYPDIANAHGNPSLNRNSTTSTKDKIFEYFSTLNEELLWGLQSIYQDDFDLFGYNPYFRIKQAP